jgi:hypothetical protein
MHYIDSDDQDAFIVEHTGIDLATVRTVMRVEFEYMAAVGLIDGPVGQWKYYAPEQLQGADPIVDVDRLAIDAERLAGVPAAIALEIFDAELKYLRLKGIAEDR